MQNQKPPCRHFERCGGCNMQHLPEVEYYAQKQRVLADSLQRLCCEAEVLQPVVRVGPAQRRRVEFKIAVNKGNISLGFCEEKSNVVVDIYECLVIEPAIFDFAQRFKTLLRALKKTGNIEAINITNLDKDFDVFVLVKAPIANNDKEKLIEFATQNRVLRLAEKVGKEELKIMANFAPVYINFGAAKVELPVGAFLQATEIGQNAIANFVVKNLAGAKMVADLYCGCGTYSFPLAQAGCNVEGYEGNYDMVMAFNNGVRQNGLDAKMSAQSRDLFKKPLRAGELRGFDALVINPPRNGALPQVQEIAKAGVRRVVMVSCNPQTFERDAKALLNAGYILQEVVPIDQFFWTNHLELAAYFKK